VVVLAPRQGDSPVPPRIAHISPERT
jgi:hypothetical protein